MQTSPHSAGKQPVVIRLLLACGAIGLLLFMPDQESVIRLVGSVLREIDDEWQIERRYFSLDSMRKLREPHEALSSSPGALQLGPIR